MNSDRNTWTHTENGLVLIIKQSLTPHLCAVICLLFIHKTTLNPDLNLILNSTQMLSHHGPLKQSGLTNCSGFGVFSSSFLRLWRHLVLITHPFMAHIVFLLIAPSPLVFSHLTPSTSLWYPFYQTLSLSSSLRQFPSVLIPSLLSYLALHSCLQCHSHFTDDCAASRPVLLPLPRSLWLSLSFSPPTSLYPSAQHASLRARIFYPISLCCGPLMIANCLL